MVLLVIAGRADSPGRGSSADPDPSSAPTVPRSGWHWGVGSADSIPDSPFPIPHSAEWMSS